MRNNLEKNYGTRLCQPQHHISCDTSAGSPVSPPQTPGIRCWERRGRTLFTLPRGQRDESWEGGTCGQLFRWCTSTRHSFYSAGMSEKANHSPAKALLQRENWHTTLHFQWKQRMKKIKPTPMRKLFKEEWSRANDGISSPLACIPFHVCLGLWREHRLIDSTFTSSLTTFKSTAAVQA